MRWLDVPHERQRSSSWCLPASIAMVSAYWEQPLTQEDIARWLGTRDIGTPAGRITQLERRGFAVLYTTGGLEQLRELLAQSVPPILFVHTGDLLPHWRVSVPHAIVLAGIEGDSAILFDPAMDTAPVTVLLGNLMLAWSHTDYAFAVLRPKNQ